ncbi:MAG: S41 family peptidase, partial [Lewinella sp.]|nr:S41 family peptidase [Lewinella sp.]
MNKLCLTCLTLGWLFVCLIVADPTYAQDNKIDTDFKTATIERLNSLMVENYVFPDVAKETADDLNKKLKAGEFDAFDTPQSFAEALTKAVQAINKDKHMRIRPTPPRESPDNSPERLIEEHLDILERSQGNMAGFKAAKRLDGNIGYLDLRGFAAVGNGGPVADHYMQLLSGADAIIIDLRKNGGGDPNMVQYLCSFFFDKKVHLNSLYWRGGDQTQEFWTLDQVGGKKMPDVPLFVLTSNYTFSGAEEFSYNMQTQKRATLVGETTGGGANPGGTFPINEKLMVFIPTGRAINPITGTNWEGVGVVPEVKTSAEEALDKAVSLATEAAEKYRKQRHERNKGLLTQLHKSINQFEENGSD